MHPTSGALLLRFLVSCICCRASVVAHCKSSGNAAFTCESLSSTTISASWNPPEASPATAYYDLNAFTYSSESLQQLKKRRTITVASVMHAQLTSGLPTSAKLSQAAADAQMAAAKFGPLDMLLFPEDFTVPRGEPWYRGESPNDGLTVTYMRAVARRLQTYVIVPIWELKRNTTYNTAVLLDRDGSTVGLYRKIFLTDKERSGSGLTASADGVHTFDLDFGRVAILVCWDQQFSELWQAVAALGADVVFWPAEGAGGPESPLMQSYAASHSYYVVANGRGDSYDMLGRELPSHTLLNVSDGSTFGHKVSISSLDLDVGICKDCEQQMRAVAAEHPGLLSIQTVTDSFGSTILARATGGLHLRALMKQRGISTTREQRQRTRQKANWVRDDSHSGQCASGNNASCLVLAGGSAAVANALNVTLGVKLQPAVSVVVDLMLYNQIFSRKQLAAQQKADRSVRKAATIVSVLPSSSYNNDISSKLAQVARLAAQALVEFGKLDILLLSESLNVPASDPSFEGEQISFSATILRMQATARQLQCYVVAPIRELDASTSNRTTYSTAVLIDRAGGIVGTYRSLFPSESQLAQGVSPAASGIGLFDTDFGRLNLVLGAEVQIPEVWRAAAASGAEVVLWAAAEECSYSAAMYAAQHSYYVLGSSCRRVAAFDQLGRVMDYDGELPALPQSDSVVIMKRLVLDSAVLVSSDAVTLLRHYPDLQVVADVPSQKWSLVAAKTTVDTSVVSVYAALEKLQLSTKNQKIALSRLKSNLLRSNHTGNLTTNTRH